MLQVVGEILAHARQLWNDNMQAILTSLGEWCPPWQAEQSADSFPSKALMQQLLGNKAYPQITPFANKLNDMIKAAQSIMATGATSVFPPDVINNACTVRDLARATTSLTFVVFVS